MSHRSEGEVKAWWDKYNSYLSSQTWNLKRNKVFARDRGTCQACMSRKAEEVHHLTYDHVFNEPLFDLVAVCKECHLAITLMDRSRIKQKRNTDTQRSRQDDQDTLKHNHHA